MTDQRIRRLVKHFGLEQGDAEKLVAAGISTPRLIKAASDGQLIAIPQVGQATVDRIRTQIE